MSTLEIGEGLESLKRIRRMKGLFLELRGRIGEQIAIDSPRRSLSITGRLERVFFRLDSYGEPTLSYALAGEGPFSHGEIEEHDEVAVFSQSEWEALQSAPLEISEGKGIELYESLAQPDAEGVVLSVLRVQKDTSYEALEKFVAEEDDSGYRGGLELETPAKKSENGAIAIIGTDLRYADYRADVLPGSALIWRQYADGFRVLHFLRNEEQLAVYLADFQPREG